MLVQVGLALGKSPFKLLRCAVFRTVLVMVRAVMLVLERLRSLSARGIPMLYRTRL